jgi:hypothetical protein
MIGFERIQVTNYIFGMNLTKGYLQFGNHSLRYRQMNIYGFSILHQIKTGKILSRMIGILFIKNILEMMLK